MDGEVKKEIFTISNGRQAEQTTTFEGRGFDVNFHVLSLKMIENADSTVTLMSIQKNNNDLGDNKVYTIITKTHCPIISCEGFGKC